MTPETVSLQALDGVTLEADVIRVDSDSPRAFVVIAHPHPGYGGDRHNHVVRAIQQAAHALGCHSVAPDFRGAGGSMGIHDDGISERLDIAAACELASFVCGDVPIIIAGYSFGAAVALNVTHPAAVGWLAVAPPATMLSPSPVAARTHLPKSVLVPQHDQFAPFPAIAEATEDWRNTTVTVIDGADHFLAAGAEDAVVAALSGLLGSTS